MRPAQRIAHGFSASIRARGCGTRAPSLRRRTDVFTNLDAARDRAPGPFPPCFPARVRRCYPTAPVHFNSRKRFGVSLVAALLLTLLQAAAFAHDVPEDTTIRMFIKPEGFRLHVLARVQMASINDIDWPLQKVTGYLDLPKIDPFLRDAGTMWISDYMDVYENGRKIGPPEVASVRIVPDGDLSFEDTYEAAVAHMKGEKIPESTNLFPLQGLLDVMFDYKITSPEASFAIDPRFDRLGVRVTTNLKFIRANGAVRAFEYVGLPGVVRLDPSWFEASRRFVQMGFFHLLASPETLLLLICLAVPFRRAQRLVLPVALFTAAYSITFVASTIFNMAPDVLWFQPFVSLLLACAIFYVGIENILGARLDRRWAVALVSGLAYGFAFAGAVQTMVQFAGAHPTVSILAFTLGIDAAMATVVLLTTLGLALFFRFVAEERVGTIVISALVAHTAWHWMGARYTDFRKYPLHLPPLDLLLLASVLRWLMAGVVLAAIVWIVRSIGAGGDQGSGVYGGTGLHGDAEERRNLYQPTK
jgi:hypothetical protein